MPRLFTFQLPDGRTELHLRGDEPREGMTVTVLGRDYLVVAIEEDRCMLQPCDGAIAPQKNEAGRRVSSAPPTGPGPHTA
jgi:hypothetical protein